jgi:dolichyl-phosphate-mannose--protein O-mannosyl transferase
MTIDKLWEDPLCRTFLIFILASALALFSKRSASSAYGAILTGVFLTIASVYGIFFLIKLYLHISLSPESRENLDYCSSIRISSPRVPPSQRDKK